MESKTILPRAKRSATERCSLYESSQLPVGRGARTPGAASRTDNFTQSLRSEPNGSCRKLRRKCTQEPSRTKSAVIADRTHPDRPTPRLSSPQRLRVETTFMHQSFAPKQHLPTKSTSRSSHRSDLPLLLPIASNAPTYITSTRRSIPHSLEPRFPPASSTRRSTTNTRSGAPESH
jgi:hypothetical protein